jgi:hypothetical protein
VQTLELLDSYEVISHPEYRAVIDDFTNSHGEQMCLMHIEFDTSKFNASVMKRMLDEWAAFRSVTDAPLYGIEDKPDDKKWERFVTHLGFQNTNCRVDCSDGQSRRLFVSLPLPKDFTDEHERHTDAAEDGDHEPVGRPDPVSH